MIISITVVGAVIVSSTFTTSDITDITKNLKLTDTQTDTIKIIGYDTRDGPGLTRIDGNPNGLDNNSTNKLLCASSCNVTPDLLPIDDGTDFIVLKVRSISPDVHQLLNIEVNDIVYTWNSTITSLNSTGQVLASETPANGQFGIIPISNSPTITYWSGTFFEGFSEARIIIKLNMTADDIELNEPIQLRFRVAGTTDQTFVVSSGGAR